MTWQQFTTIVKTLGYFVGGYAACMATHPHGEWFEWGCLATALVPLVAFQHGLYTDSKNS